MKCKNCGRPDVPDGSGWCCWCGKKILSGRRKSTDIRVPNPRQLPSGNWFIQLRINGESIPVTEPSERACREKARAIKAGLLSAEKPPKPSKKIVGEILDEYIQSRSNILSPSTIRSYKHIRKFRFQGIMDLDVHTLTQDALQKAINDDAANVKPKTLKNAWGFVKTALSPYTDVVAQKYTLPEVRVKDIAVYDKEQLRQLFAACRDDPVELAVLLAACLGLRRSEILALEYEDFDRKAKTVTINKARVPNENNELVTKGTKTAGSVRTLPVPDFIMSKVPKGKTGLLYPDCKQNWMQGRLRRICQRAGLPLTSMHKLRHANASVMLALNIPDKYAMERGGWSNNQTMKRIYQHTTASERKKTDDTVDAFFAGLQNANENANVS